MSYTLGAYFYSDLSTKMCLFFTNSSVYMLIYYRPIFFALAVLHNKSLWNFIFVLFYATIDPNLFWYNIECIMNVIIFNFHTGIEIVFNNNNKCAYFFLDFKCSMCLALCLFFSPFRVYRAYKDVLIKRNRCMGGSVSQNRIFWRFETKKRA